MSSILLGKDAEIAFKFSFVYLKVLKILEAILLLEYLLIKTLIIGHSLTLQPWHNFVFLISLFKVTIDIVLG